MFIIPVASIPLQPPRLVYLGPVTERAGSPGPVPPVPFRHGERRLEPGDAIALVRRRSPWKLLGGRERVILGSDEKRADVLLRGAGIDPEHLRLYIDVEGGAADLWALRAGATCVGGTPVAALGWAGLCGGEEIDIGVWRFRYEVSLKRRGDST